MTDSTDDMEWAAGGMFCQTCDEHFEDCECEEEHRKWEITDPFDI